MPRRLGQHFLRPASVERLLRVIDPREGDVFLEIGPGAGALTLPLAGRAREMAHPRASPEPALITAPSRRLTADGVSQCCEFHHG